MTEPNNSDIREMIKERRLTYEEVGKHLPNKKRGAGHTISAAGLRRRLDKDLSEEERGEIIEAIEQALTNITGLI